MAFQDKLLTCVDCGSQFVFSADDQAYYAEKGYANEPKRCPSCRQSRRSQRNTAGGSYGSMGRQLYPAVCAQCGKDTEVPFQPRGDRPVYCSDCFRQRTGAGSDRY